MATLKFKQTGETVELPDGSPIAGPCEKAGVPIACSRGFCGACAVVVTKGMENLTKPTQEEIDFFGEEGVKKERMACQCSINRGEVELSF